EFTPCSPELVMAESPTSARDQALTQPSPQPLQNATLEQGALQGRPQRPGEDPECQAGGRGDTGRGRRPDGEPGKRGGGRGVRYRPGEDRTEPAQVVEEAEQAVDHHEQGQPAVSAVPDGGGSGELADEHGRRWGAH